MPRFSANISMLFTEQALPGRFAAAAEAGFAAVEIQFPYEHPPRALAEAREGAGVEVALINIPAGDLSAGERGIAGLPGREDEFREGVALAADYAEALGCTLVNVLAGLRPEGVDRQTALDTLAGNLAFAGEAMAGRGVTVLLEAVNDTTMPGFLVNRTTDALAAIERAGHPNLAIQADIFHMAMMGEEIVPALRSCALDLGHIQFADVPGRHQPGTGGLDFQAIFAAIDRLDYKGWVGAEYQPSGATTASLGWLEAFA
ncbi:MAG: hydroxypyruvate isomerase family protein [Alphaproteobacteria bacterium]